MGDSLNLKKFFLLEKLHALIRINTAGEQASNCAVHKPQMPAALSRPWESHQARSRSSPFCCLLTGACWTHLHATQALCCCLRRLCAAHVSS